MMAGRQSKAVDNMEIRKTSSLKSGMNMLKALENPVRYFNQLEYHKRLGLNIFYHLGKEHWLGLDNIYALTNRQNVAMQLRVYMEKFTDENATEYYDNFSLQDQVNA